jgi:hypothetical protein
MENIVLSTKKYILNFIPVLVIVFLSSCGLDREIEIKLPEYTSQPVVQCYLEVGAPLELTLSKSASYFETFPTDPLGFIANSLINDAVVNVKVGTENYLLDPTFSFNPVTKLYSNYSNPYILDAPVGSTISLDITLKDGKKIFSSAEILPKVEIDSITVEFNSTDTLARSIMYYKDDRTRTNYYRRWVHKNTLDSLEFSFVTDDRLISSETSAFGTGYSFKLGDTIIQSLGNLSKEYYLFLNSVNDATNGVLNPFGQPSTIISNLRGDANAVGVFTVWSVSRKSRVVKK